MNNIEKIRKEKGLTQEKLAQMIGDTQQHISRWENGKRNPSVKTLMKLSKALEVPIEELISHI